MEITLFSIAETSVCRLGISSGFNEASRSRGTLIPNAPELVLSSSFHNHFVYFLFLFLLYCSIHYLNDDSIHLLTSFQTSVRISLSVRFACLLRSLVGSFL